jgi:hypothetical protein
MDAGHGCPAKISVGDRLVRFLSHMVGINRPPCRAGRMQRSQSINSLSGTIYVALLIAFKGASQFGRVDLGAKSDLN